SRGRYTMVWSLPLDRGDYMAFMPEDVLNKNFTATQFRRGYDEQEVDDFLDEVVVELRRLSSDGDDLRTQLKACQESKGIAVPTGAAANGNPKVAQLEAKVAQLEAAAVSMSAAGRGAQDKMVNAGSGAEKGEKGGAARIARAKAGAEQVEKDAAARIARAKAGTEQVEKDAAARIARAKAGTEQVEKDAAARIAKAKAGAEQVEARAAERVKTAKDTADKGA